MRGSLKYAKYELAKIVDRNVIEAILARCALDETDIEILRRVHIHKESQVQVAIKLHLAPETVGKRYRRAVMVFHAVAVRYVGTL